jgi:hypothetical protein
MDTPGHVDKIMLKAVYARMQARAKAAAAHTRIIPAGCTHRASCSSSVSTQHILPMLLAGASGSRTAVTGNMHTVLQQQQ